MYVCLYVCSSHFNYCVGRIRFTWGVQSRYTSSNMSKMSKTKTMFVSKEQVLPVLPINRGPNYKTIQGN